jgi:N-acetylmuramoyl-L-alanine amidase
MPAILVETSFISNPEEEKLLASSEYQSAVAQAIAGGIHAFIGDREKVAQTQTN